MRHLEKENVCVVGGGELFAPTHTSVTILLSRVTCFLLILILTNSGRIPLSRKRSEEGRNKRKEGARREKEEEEDEGDEATFYRRRGDENTIFHETLESLSLFILSFMTHFLRCGVSS